MFGKKRKLKKVKISIDGKVVSVYESVHHEIVSIEENTKGHNIKVELSLEKRSVDGNKITSMYQVRFEKKSNEFETRFIETKVDLEKLAKGRAKNSIIECRISSGMPSSLHDAIAKHNERVELNSM